MRRLEIIHLRSSSDSLGDLADLIRESIRDGREGKEVVTLYRRRGLDTDLAVHLHTAGKSGAARPSRLALQLAAALRAYGLVEHTLWEELE
jgi:hypothetical protein